MTKAELVPCVDGLTTYLQSRITNEEGKVWSSICYPWKKGTVRGRVREAMLRKQIRNWFEIRELAIPEIVWHDGFKEVRIAGDW